MKEFTRLQSLHNAQDNISLFLGHHAQPQMANVTLIYRIECLVIVG